MYKQVKISAPSFVSTAFKDTCAENGVSMASVLSQFMADYSNVSMKKNRHSPDYTTKRKRRSAVKSIIQHLEQIRAAEEQYRDHIPENLQGSVVFENAEQTVSLLEETIDLLDSF